MRVKSILFAAGMFCVPVVSSGVPSNGQDATEEAAKITNAHVEKRTISRPLAEEMRALITASNAPTWVGYSVPMVAGNRMLSRGNYNVTREGASGHCGTCRLERSNDDDAEVNWDDAGSAPEDARILVLAKIADRKIDQMRVASPECTLDAGGRAVVWLTGVKPAESVAWLETFVQRPRLRCIKTAQPTARSSPSWCRTNPRSYANARRSGLARQEAKRAVSRSRKWPRTIPAPKYAGKSRSRSRLAMNRGPWTT